LFIISYILAILLFPLATLHAYTSNESIVVSRVMPAYAYSGQTVTIQITISVANDIVAPAQGFYFVDNIPDNLSLSISSYAVKKKWPGLNGYNCRNRIF